MVSLVETLTRALWMRWSWAGRAARGPVERVKASRGAAVAASPTPSEDEEPEEEEEEAAAAEEGEEEKGGVGGGAVGLRPGGSPAPRA